MHSTNCSSGSNFPWVAVAGVLAVSVTVHAIAPTHYLGLVQLPPQEHTELSSKSTASVGIYAAGVAFATSESTLLSTALTIRY